MQRLPVYAFGALCLATVVGFFVFPTYPNYDSYYSLLWGREVLHGHLPAFTGFRVPTEHPLGIAAGLVLSLLGHAGDRVWVALCLAAFLWLVAGIYRLGTRAFTPFVGAVSAFLLISRFDFPFLAARGYIDVPFMALVVWAMVLEGERPRRGASVLVCLALAGLLRPEGWLMAGAYWLWLFPALSWRDRVRMAALAAVGPAVWFGVDAVVTGDPLFSLHYTSASAEDLGRSRSIGDIPSAVPYFLSNLVKLPVLGAALAGIVLALVITPRRAMAPLALFLVGLGTFLAIGIAGSSIIERYLTVAALALLIFAAVAIGGWTMLVPGTRWRQVWAGAALLLVLGGATYTALNVNLRRFDQELTFRGDAHRALASVLRAPAVRAGLRCGPLSAPNHKLVPDSRWLANLSHRDVVARADAHPPRPPDTGVALFVLSRFAIFKHAWTQDSDPAAIEVPQPGWKRVSVTDFYAAYTRC